MQFRTKEKRKVMINITSLIDVLFLLLIFLMVSSTFLEQPGIKLELPESESAANVEKKDYTL
ncbi:MAG: biopolymer transporter ExbD, partial [bacterium]|nr:biopolymer transporter ExbD [bacterium]